MILLRVPLLLLLIICHQGFHGVVLSNSLIGDAFRFPLIIDHGGGGESVGLPEHTIPAYEFAMHAEADFIGPDLVLTKDFVMVCHNGLTLANSTDVRERAAYAYLRIVEKNVTINNIIQTIRDDWLISDFTYAQLKTLKVVQRNAESPKHFDRLFDIPTFDEFMEAIQSFTLKSVMHRKLKVIGIIPMLKHPSYFNALAGIPFFMEGIFIKKLEACGYSLSDETNAKRNVSTCTYNANKIPCNPLIVQCHDFNTIEYLSNTTTLRLLTVIDKNNIQYLTHEGFQRLEGKTEFVCPFKEFFHMTSSETEYDKLVNNMTQIERLGGLIPPKLMVDYAGKRRIKVAINIISNPWENIGVHLLSKKLQFEQFLELGVKAVFVEGIGESIRWRDEYTRKKSEDEKDSRMAVLIVVLLTMLLIQCRYKLL